MASSATVNETMSPNISTNSPVCHFADDDVLFIFYTVSYTVALLGNLAFLSVVIKVKSMRTMPNFFFINLSMADTLFMTYYVLHLMSQRLNIQPLKEIHYKGGHSITDVAFCVSMLTVALASLNRYIAICHPFKAERLRLQSISRIVVSIAFCWLYGIAVGVFDVLIYTYSSSIQLKLFSILLILLSVSIVASICIVLMSYILIARRMIVSKPSYIPTTVHIHTSCISEESQVLLLCASITVVFFISCFPLATLYIVTTITQVLGFVPLPRKKIACLAFVAKLMVPLHFALNPILYNIGSKNHRTAFRKVWSPRSAREQSQVAQDV
ncbi:uncharacterized protein LOC102809218 [Saccoglossus kowalevskii]|uniref:Thyrotropin-releasing hormone receptor-like n=1 Tax=Saccoglossus kowalevskii TaxID=10224 RepID=A0ABM0M9J9_SACKO|nr:PREDICTED: thyrotropin-releasing hormone receptor-like [Saccoglossus kowalevskii]